ncbi:MAG: TIR domain-containing protein [Bacteroidia bacterium]|nr:TIR domain-containing protein [Bacteroidia bacterium]
MANKEYFVTRLSFREDGQLIRDVTVYEYDGQSLDNGTTQSRQWMVNKITAGYQISVMTPNPKEEDKWIRGNPFTYEGGYFKWPFKLPLNDTKRKTFVSYYHKDDQDYRTKFENLFGDLIVSKSVEDGDIDSDNSDEYIKQLIQKEYLSDTTVLVVLVGPKTKCRKHVDWEISGAISSRVGGNSGLIGLLLPSHPDHGEGKKYNPANLPKRLAANLDSGYAKLYDWTDDRVKMQQYIENAFNGKSETEKIINKSIPQMDKDTCE